MAKRGRPARRDISADAVLLALQRNHGSIRAAAQDLGIPRNTLARHAAAARERPHPRADVMRWLPEVLGALSPQDLVQGRSDDELEALLEGAKATFEWFGAVVDRLHDMGIGWGESARDPLVLKTRAILDVAGVSPASYGDVVVVYAAGKGQVHRRKDYKTGDAATDWEISQVPVGPGQVLVLRHAAMGADATLSAVTVDGAGAAHPAG